MFNDDQISELNRPLSRSAVRHRALAGRSISYVEGWHVIVEANRIFGFDGWTSETLETHCVVERERLIGKSAIPGWTVTYNAKVRITAGGIFRDGCGTGHGIDVDVGQAHESAIKEAETDARKRALMTFGYTFGLALYDKEQSNVADDSELARRRYVEDCRVKIINFLDVAEMMRWWNGEKQTRRDLALSAEDVASLKNLVKMKLPKSPEGAERSDERGSESDGERDYARGEEGRASAAPVRGLESEIDDSRGPL